MRATTTATTTTPAAPLTPTFAPRAPGEAAPDYGRRALLFLLEHGVWSTWRLDDDALDRATHAALQALTARGIAPETISLLCATQDHLRGIAAARRTDRAARQAALEALAGEGQADGLPAVPAPSLGQPDAGSGSSGGGGGAKVPRKPLPTRGGPSAGLALPAPVPPMVAAPVLQAVPALTLAADDLF